MDIEATEAWEAFIDMRKAKGKRAPFTELAKRRILFELRRFQADGQDAEAILWASVTNGWSGVFPMKRAGWQPPSPSLTVPSRADEKSQAWIEAHASTEEQTPEQREATAQRLRETRQKLRAA